MGEDHSSKGKDSGLDLAADDLPGVLGKACGDIFLAQKSRPECMGCMDF